MFKNTSKYLFLGAFLSIALGLSAESGANEKNKLFVGVVDANRANELQKKMGVSGDSLLEEINAKISSFAKKNNLSLVLQSDTLKCFDKKHDITNALFSGEAIDKSAASARVNFSNKDSDVCTSNGNSILIKEVVFTSEQPADTKDSLAFISTDKIFRDSDLAKKESKKLELEFKKRESDIQDLNKKVNSLKNSDPEFSRLKKILEAQQEEFKKDLNAAKNSSLQEVVNKFNLVTNKFSKKKRYKLVIQEAVYVSKDLDITDELIQAANLAYKTPDNIAEPNDSDIQREREKLAEERRQLEEDKRKRAQVTTQETTPRDSPASADTRRRFALVIGNSSYSSLPKLHNTTNDSRAIAQSLRSTGFKVAAYEDLDLAGMQNAIRKFGDQLEKNDVGLVFYAGHGVQVKGKNYLIPVRENIKKSFEIPANAIDIDLILATLENGKNDLNIVILDACRSSFPGESRGANRGLATIDAARGTFIAFSTAPGKEATDGTGSNSPYTKHLVRMLERKGLPIEQVFKEVRKAVVAETNGEQTPWENSSVMGDFYFK